MATKISTIDFVLWLEKQLEDKCGYIMGSSGQNPREWKANSHWFTQYEGTQLKKALYWREHAPRVFDCAGMAEGAVCEMLGLQLKDVNTKARYIYRDWCDEKGEDIATMPKEHGMAVFVHDDKKGYITHIGYLVEPVDEDKWEGDWWVIEARGVMYGVVRTKLSARPWNRWGRMSKYFAYTGNEYGHNKMDKYKGHIKIKAKNGGHVNIRCGPGKQYERIDSVPSGTILKPMDNAEGWRAVVSNGQIGWVSSEFSEVIK